MRRREHKHTISMQIEYATMSNFDERRHKIHCIWYDSNENICLYSLSPCLSSSHCKHYRDSRNELVQRNLPEKLRILQSYREESKQINKFDQSQENLPEEKEDTWEEKNAQQIKNYFSSTSKQPEYVLLKRRKKVIVIEKETQLQPKKVTNKDSQHTVTTKSTAKKQPQTRPKSNSSPYSFLIGKSIIHKKLGNGIISATLHDRIRITLNNGEKIDIMNTDIFSGNLSIKL